MDMLGAKDNENVDLESLFLEKLWTLCAAYPKQRPSLTPKFQTAGASAKFKIYFSESLSDWTAKHKP